VLKSGRAYPPDRGYATARPGSRYGMPPAGAADGRVGAPWSGVASGPRTPTVAGARSWRLSDTHHCLRDWQRRGRRGRGRVLASALFAAGMLLVVLGLGTAAYAQWAESQHRLQQPAGPQEMLPERLDLQASGAPGRGAAAVGLVPPAGAATARSTERPVWMNIPRIKLDSSVVEVGVQDGEYQVPSFDVGHHEGSANPGEPGNSVFTGHLETINAGRVFARLKELSVGDTVYTYTRTHRYDWVVQEVRTVPNSEKSFILPTQDTRITLYTCAGTFNPLARDYTHRLVVVGKLVQAGPRS